jgi:hypothetical protein
MMGATHDCHIDYNLVNCFTVVRWLLSGISES